MQSILSRSGWRSHVWSTPWNSSFAHVFRWRFFEQIGMWLHLRRCSMSIEHGKRSCNGNCNESLMDKLAWKAPWRAPNQKVDANFLYDLIERERGPSRRGHSPRRHIHRVITKDGKLRCISCGEFKDFACFSVSRKSRLGIQSQCSACGRKRAQESRRTLRGTVQMLVGGARGRSKHPRKSGQTLVHDDIFDMLWRQKGLCYYSGIALEYTLPHSHWRVSLERLDNTRGYSKENCALIAAEFNTTDLSIRKGRTARVEGTGSSQWSIEKVSDVLRKRTEYVDVSALSSLIEHARRKTGQANRKPSSGRREPDSRGFWRCAHCATFLPPEYFHRESKSPSGLQAWCISCKRKEYARNSETLRCNALSLASNARRRDRVRGWQNSLSFHDILDMFLLQEGRCYYSGVPMDLRPFSDWRMSLERLDNARGYDRDNCVLIALEFNTSDHSRCNGAQRDDVYGTAQWSRAKVAQIWGPYWN